MRSPEIGDQVRVEFEGKVTDTIGKTVTTVFVESDTNNSWIPVEACTVIAAPVKVGDLVSSENHDRVPGGSIAARPGEVPVWKDPEETGDWFDWDSSKPCPANIAFGATLLRVGGGDS